jgi:endonuclease-3
MYYNVGMNSPKDLPALKKRWQKISRALAKLYPDAKIALNFSNPWELLVAVQLSAQCTDKKVNEVTPALFKKYRKLADYVAAGKTARGVREFENAIHACGFYRAKTRNILAAAKYITEKYKGKLPRTMAEMVKVPGVGRKSANVILGNAYGVVEGIAIDTHMIRLSNVFGLTKEKTPEKIEQDLMKIIPEKDWFISTYRIINYGRQYCVARPHKHELCPLTKVLGK